MELDCTKGLDPDLIQDVEFWRNLCPGLTISPEVALSQKTRHDEDNPVRQHDRELCKELINEDGYFAYDSWFSRQFVEQLADCLTRLEEANVLPVFCFVYDEFWELFLRLDPLLSDLVGKYWMLPAVWAWHVRDSNQTAFAPHRDLAREASVDDEDHLDYLTIWIPLTDVDYLSSNICVLPASADPDYDTGTDRVCVEDLQDIRSLQGKKGSVFCWTTGLVHWGTRQARLGNPRMSVGLYIQNPEAECFDPPPLDFDKPISLQQRLSLIGQQIINYSREASQELLKLAQWLVELESGNS